MKLWIIHKDEIELSKIIAEILQDCMEEYVDVLVGNAKKIDPALLAEERVEYFIIGDIVSKTIPSLEIQKWLKDYRDISKHSVKAVSGFYINLTNNQIEPFWVNFICKHISAEIFFPPILCFELNKSKVGLENGALERIKAYSNDFIEFIINNNRK